MEVERVQAIASFSMTNDTIPAEFIRSVNEQPAITTFRGPVPQVLVVDFSNSDEGSLVKIIANASKEWGLFQIVNHNIPNDVIKKLQVVGKEFFELPQEEKEKYAKPVGSQSVEGYGTKVQKEVEGKKGWVDHLFHKIWPPSVINYQFWPKTPSSYRDANEEYAKCLHGVVDKLFRALSLGLGLEGKELEECVGGGDLIYLLKINCYPHVLGLIWHLGWWPTLICPPSPSLFPMMFGVSKFSEMINDLMWSAYLMPSSFTLVTN